MKTKGLTLEQERAANLFSMGKSIGDKAIAKKVGVTTGVLSSWKSKPQFKMRVLQLFEEHLDLERTDRFKRVGKYLSPVYKEITKRLREEDALEVMSLKELLRTMTVLHNELRQDANFKRQFAVPIDLNESNDKGSEVNEDDLDDLTKARLRYTKSRKDVKENDGKVVPLINAKKG